MQNFGIKLREIMTRRIEGVLELTLLCWGLGKFSQTGLRELLAKGFLAPRSPNLYWVNPALFFKGDRVAFVKEYRRRPKIEDRHELT